MTGFQLVLQLVEQFNACTSIQGQRFEYCTSLSTVFRLQCNSMLQCNSIQCNSMQFNAIQCMYQYTGSKIWILYKPKYSFQASFWKKKLLKTAMILFFTIQAEDQDWAKLHAISNLFVNAQHFTHDNNLVDNWFCQWCISFILILDLWF